MKTLDSCCERSIGINLIYHLLKKKKKKKKEKKKRWPSHKNKNKKGTKVINWKLNFIVQLESLFFTVVAEKMRFISTNNHLTHQLKAKQCKKNLKFWWSRQSLSQLHSTTIPKQKKNPIACLPNVHPSAVRQLAGPPLIRPKSPHVCLDWKKKHEKKNWSSSTQPVSRLPLPRRRTAGPLATAIRSQRSDDHRRASRSSFPRTPDTVDRDLATYPNWASSSPGISPFRRFSPLSRPLVVFGDQIWSVITSGPVIWCSRHSGLTKDGERRCGRGRTWVGHVVARLPWATPVWLSGSGSGSGVGG